jgi:flagellar assembly protein FliH
MLSRVLTGRDAARAQPAAFPLLQVSPCEPASHRGVAANDASGEGMSALRERIGQLEAQLANERRESFEAGRKQGDQQARAEIQPILERLNQSIVEIVSLRPEMRRRAEKDSVQLALLIAKRVLHRELNVDEGALTAIARVVFEHLTRAETYRVIVNPRFAGAITAALPGGVSARVHLEPDPGCAPGTLIIHSPEGVIDASVDAQLEEISRGLADRLARS